MAKDIVNSSVGAIKLIDEESSDLRLKAAYFSKQVIFENNIQNYDDEHLKNQLKSFLGVPLKIGERTIGMFELGSLNTNAFGNEEKQMLKTLASQAAVAIENARLFENTQHTYFETIRSLAQALEARDSYTRGHSERVTKYSILLASQLRLDERYQSILGYAGLLHDIGKIGISDAILHKPDDLTAEERKIIENHPLFGENIIGPIKFLKEAQLAVLHHHEWYNGSGYPAGIKGEAIPVTARIIGVADAFDAMTSERPYRSALSVSEACTRLTDNSGTQFDPTVIDAFIVLVDKGFIP